MRSLAAFLVLSALPSSAATLKTFEKQFRGAAVARETARAVDHTLRNDHDGALIKLMVYALAVPYALSYELPEEGFSNGLYASGRGDLGDASSQHRLELSGQQVSSFVKGYGGRWRVDTERHVGLEAFWTNYIEHRAEDLHYVGASAHGDIARGPYGRVDYQLGMAALSGRLTRVGPRVGVEGELYPLKPFFLDALAAVNLIDGGPLGELRAGGGVAWKRAQLRLSWRALIGPFKNLAGPELAFLVRL